MSLSPSVGAPALEVGKDAWAAPMLDAPSKGLNPVKRDIVLPEIRETELTTDRLRRPETGGPKIAASAVPIPVPAFSQRLNRNREQENAAADLGPLGPQTEQAIENGLQFLARYQRADGSWHLEDFGEKVDIRSETAATALALLSFQGAGYTHRQFKYEKTCGNAVGWMVKNQRANGDLYVRTDAKSDGNSWLYSHAIATLAMCEAYGMTQDESIKDNAQRAINFLIASQDPQGGGWRYQPKVGSDTSVTGWCMMALKSAELSGLEVSKDSYTKIGKWLDASQASENQKYLYRYNWQAPDTPAARHGRVPTPVMTSVGLLMRLYLGWRRDNPQMQQGADWLIERIPAEGSPQNPQKDTYYWYYATQVIFHMGGERWKTWYGNLYPLLIRTQSRDGEFAGSWEPNGRIPDAWGRYGGRLYVTTLNLLSLEVYYRHLPIYDATAD
jgi:prenyltransferase beta subunit